MDHGHAHGGRGVGEDALRRTLHDAGLRVTLARMATLRVMNAAGEALDAATILARVVADVEAGREAEAAQSEDQGEGAIDRVTVYRTLNSFVEKGLAHKVDPGDRVFRFSLTDHARCAEHKHDHEHPHLVCDSCGSVRCMPDAQVFIQEKPMVPGQRGDGAPKPRALRQQDVTLRGTCDECEDGAGKKPAR